MFDIDDDAVAVESRDPCAGRLCRASEVVSLAELLELEISFSGRRLITTQAKLAS